MSKTGYECTAYFRGIDGLGTCDDNCQWWRYIGDTYEKGCVCAKGSKLWDGKEYYLKEINKKGGEGGQP